MSQNLPWCRLKVVDVTHVDTFRPKPHDHVICNVLTSKAAAGSEMVSLMMVPTLTLSFSCAVWFMINRTFSKYHMQQRNSGRGWLCGAYYHRYIPGWYSADTWRNNNVIITSKRRRNVVLPWQWRYYWVAYPLGICEMVGLISYNVQFSLHSKRNKKSVFKANVLIAINLYTSSSLESIQLATHLFNINTKDCSAVFDNCALLYIVVFVL